MAGSAALDPAPDFAKGPVAFGSEKEAPGMPEKLDPFRTPCYKSLHSVASLRQLSDYPGSLSDYFGLGVRIHRNAHKGAAQKQAAHSSPGHGAETRGAGAQAVRQKRAKESKGTGCPGKPKRAKELLPLALEAYFGESDRMEEVLRRQVLHESS